MGPIRREAGLVVAWSGIGLGSIVLAICLSRSDLGIEIAVGVAIGIGLISALGVQAIALIAAPIDAARQEPVLPIGARPADGRVDVWPMVGVASEPIAGTRWKQFAPGAGTANDLKVGRRAACGERPLLGHVALISVFVGRDGHAWTDGEVGAAHRSLARAGEWVEREATRWGALVNIGLADTCFRVEDPTANEVAIEFVPEGDDVGPLEADATIKAVAAASRAAAQLGFADLADLVARIDATVAADAHVWLWHLKARGRSHAIPIRDRILPGVGLAICYARESSFPEPLFGPGRVDPVTVAHELMHLFGASDKYGVALSRFDRGEVPRLDIMRLDSTRLDRLRIGRLTAREVGWAVERRALADTVRKQKPAPRRKPGSGS